MRGAIPPLPNKSSRWGTLLSIGTTLPLCGYKTLSLTLWEEHELRVSENGVLRRRFGPMKEEDGGGWKRMRNEELHNLHD
jgi:hypothetical protein